MGVVATYHPASRLLEWNTGKSNLIGGAVSNIDGSLLICGYNGVFLRYNPDGTLILDMQKPSSLDITDVSVAGDGSIFADTIERAFSVVYRYDPNGVEISHHSRPGIPDKVGGIYAKIWVYDPYIFLPNFQVASPYRIRLAMYNYTTYYVMDEWLVTDAGLVNSCTSGLFIDSTRTYAYASFLDLGVVVKFLMHTEGGLWYLQKVWQYGTIAGHQVNFPTGIGVDETHGFVYVISEGEPYSILILDAATGALLWTWDSFHTYGTRTVESFTPNTELLVDTLGDIYVISLNGMIRKFKGFYDTSTHETLVITSPDAVQLWRYQFGPA